ncbi:MAG: hypothetical protein QOJ04_3239, partial [Caballeronia sp.]|nr:hypothetical protein [Caballeronia sp.]
MIVRSSRPLHSQPCFLSRSRRAALIAASVASVLLGTFVSSDATAQAGSASAVSDASAPAAASAGAITQYSVKPGQSLSDIASQITGSTDRATREKMARALFDANPNAFMGHDPSRLKLGSVLNVPVVEDAAAAAAASGASAPMAASAPAVEASGSAAVAAPAEGASNAAGAVNGAATASGAVAAVAPNVSSEPNAALPTSEAQPSTSASAVASASEATPASEAAPALNASSAPAATVAPVSAPSATGSTAISVNGPIGWLIGAVVVIGLLLLVMRAGKRRRVASAAAADERTQEPPPVSTPPETTVVSPHHGLASHAQSPTGAADLDSASIERGQGELNVVAASMENYDAAQSFDTPTEDKPFLPAESNVIDDDADGARVTLSESRAPDAGNPARDLDAKRAPFMPDAPAALHRDFTPPR